MSVSACFPAYNEEATVGAVIEEAAAVLEEAGVDHEILVCDDASTDETGTIVEALATRLPHLRIITHATNVGLQGTFEELYREASKSFVFLNATDGQWPNSILLEMLPLTADWDVIIASRRNKHYNLRRTLVSWAFNLAPRLLFGVKTHDAGAVKLVRREVFELPLVSRSAFAEAERLVRAQRAGYRITAVAVDTNPRQAGESTAVRPSAIVASLADLWRVWRAIR